ncbi:hypothetical protein AB0I91_10750 [Actinosynnema sp. NPDC049800]
MPARTATEADLMNLSGHEDRRTLERYLEPSKEGTHRRLDAIDACRPEHPQTPPNLPRTRIHTQ